MKSLGIDPSTKTGIVLLDGQLMTHGVVQPKGYEGTARIAKIRDEFMNLLLDFKPDIAVIEGYAYGNKFTLSLMVEINSCMRLCLHDLGIEWYIAPPTVLKKYVTNSGSAKKPQIAEAVKNRWGFVSPSDDVVDAYVLAQMGKDLAANGVTPLLKGVERGQRHLP